MLPKFLGNKTHGIENRMEENKNPNIAPRAAKQITLANKSIPKTGSLLPSNHYDHYIGYVLNPLTLLLIHLSSRLTLILPTLSAHLAP